VYFSLQFANPGSARSLNKPSITLTGVGYTMEVMTDCTTEAPLSCPSGAGTTEAVGGQTEVASAQGITHWTMDWSFIEPSPSCGTMGANTCSNKDSTVVTKPVVVKVTRTMVFSPCDQFTLFAVD
jgi:hypothetical protein